MDRNRTSRYLRRVTSVVHAVALFLAMMVICLPGVWIVLSSLRPTVEIMAKPPVWIPHELSLQAFISMFGVVGQGGVPVLDYFRNSLIISLLTSPFSVELLVSTWVTSPLTFTCSETDPTFRTMSSVAACPTLNWMPVRTVCSKPVSSART